MIDRRPQILDELLIAQARAGDRKAFERVATRWQERLWRHAFRLTGSETAAWDVLQESWLVITRGLRRLREPSRFRAWAYAIVTKQAALYHRRLAATPAQADVDAVPEPPPDAASPPVERLRAALARLPGAARALLALKYDEGFAVGEIAEILGVPAGTVKSRLHHARERLKAIVDTMETNESDTRLEGETQ